MQILVLIIQGKDNVSAEVVVVFAIDNLETNGKIAEHDLRYVQVLISHAVFLIILDYQMVLLVRDITNDVEDQDLVISDSEKHIVELDFSVALVPWSNRSVIKILEIYIG